MFLNFVDGLRHVFDTLPASGKLSQSWKCSTF